MMKILQLGKAYPPVNFGGVEVVIQLLTEGLNDNNIVCDAMGVNDQYKYQEEGYKNGTIYRAKLIAKKFSTLWSFQLINLLREKSPQYDIITIHSPDPMACLALFIVNPKSKVVLYWHSDILKQQLLLRLYNPLLRWLLNRADMVIATTPTYRSDSEYLKSVIHKCEVVPIGLNIINSTIEDCERFRNFKGKKIIFSLGRLAYYKGFEYLILAAKTLPADFIIVIAGEGEEYGKLLNLIESNGLENKVFLVGKVSEKEKDFLFYEAALFVLSSIYKTEAYAIVQVEAMARGLPIVSTRIAGSGVPWVNQHGVTGITVPIKDSNAIANAVCAILQDEALYQEYSTNAMKRYKALFTRDKMIDRLVNIYEKLLS